MNKAAGPSRGTRAITTPGLEVAGWIALVTIGLFAMIMRFVGIDRAPPGFYVDEAAVSAQVFCLAQGGHTLDGARWPLLTPVLGGGYSSIAYQAPAVAWAKVDGGSISAMRRFAALCGALAVIGVFLAALWASETEAATTAGPRAFASLRMTTATVAAVSAAISPWAFQFSRIAWDPAVAPVYLSWALAALFLAVRPNERRDWVARIAIVASALLFGAACLCYPPLRMQVPLVLLAFVVWKRRWAREHWAMTAGFVVVFAAATAQLWMQTIDGSVQGRFNELSVFSSWYWIDHGVTTRGGVLVNGAWLFIKNFLAHFAPSYLLISGDANLRHSTQMFGEWSWFDALAIVSATVVLVRRRERPSGWMTFAAFGYVAGVLPSALTWEGVPHALRSIGALPFLCILVGGTIATLADAVVKARRFIPITAAGVAFVFLAAFLPVFFVDYPPRAADMFDAPAAEKLSQPDLARMLASPSEEQPVQASAYPTLAIQYYELRAGAIRCERK